jgi:hypothetical protein
MITPVKRKVTIFVGQPSWHQLQAGHTYVGSITLLATEEEIDTYVSNTLKNDPKEIVSVVPHGHDQLTLT